MKKSFVDWVDEGGMWIKKGWDIETNKPTSSAPLQLFPHQRDILGHCLTPDKDGYLPYQTIVYSCPKKCLTDHEKVWLADGRVVEAWELIGKDFLVYSYDEKLGKIVESKASAQSNGTDKCFYIKTKSGIELIRNAPHPLYTWDGWKAVEELKSGDYIGIPDKIPEPKNPVKMDNREVRFIAYLLAEGYLGKGVVFSTGSDVILSRMKESCNYLGFELVQYHKYDYGIKGAYEYVEELGLIGKSSQSKSIPDVIFQLSDEQIVVFISACIDCDGWVCTARNGSTGRVQLGISSISKEIRDGLLLLFNRLGFHPMCRNRELSNGRLSGYTYDLQFSNSDELLRLHEILYLDEKQKRFNEVIEVCKSRKIHRRSWEEKLPRTVWKEIKEGKGQRPWSDYFPYRVTPTVETWGMYKELAIGLAETYEIEGLAEKINQPIVWDRIEEIVEIGEYPIVSITVPGHENFMTYVMDHNSGKTQIGAAIGAWYADCGEEESEIFAIANDKEQASRIFGDITYHFRKIGKGYLKADSISFENGTYIQTLAQHYASAAGARQALTLWDELWAYVHERSQLMWAEMTPPPTVKNTMRVVVTYAGIMGQTASPLLDLYNKCYKMEKGKYVAGEVVPELEHIVDLRGEPVCRRDKEAGLFMYWDTEPRMPWQTKEYYRQQLQTLRSTDFLRQHKNQWVSSSEDFIPIGLWDESATLSAPITSHKEQDHAQLPLFIGIDVGTKHDCSAAVAVSYNPDTGEVFLCDHKIWTPMNGESIDLETTVEQYLRYMHSNFYVKMVPYDPSQFQRSASSLNRAGLPMVEYTQTVTNMTMATQALYSVLNTGMFRSYKAEDLRDHIRFSRVSMTTRGMRIVKDRNAMYKIDAAIALAMAVKCALGFGDPGQREAIKVVSPFSDLSSTHVPTYKELQERFLPEPLRDI